MRDGRVRDVLMSCLLHDDFVWRNANDDNVQGVKSIGCTDVDSDVLFVMMWGRKLGTAVVAAGMK